MLPRCQFCNQYTTRLCCAATCRFNPFMCTGNCVASASSKVHSHQQSVQFVGIEELKVQIQQRLNGILLERRDFGGIGKIMARITDQLENIVNRFMQEYRQLIGLDPEINQILTKIQNHDKSLTGKDIHSILFEKLYDPDQPRNRMAKQLQQNLRNTFLRVQQTLNTYKSYNQKVVQSNIILEKSFKLMKQQRYTQSIRILEQGLKINPLKPQILYELGYCYSKTGGMLLSIQYYQKAYIMSPYLKSDAINNIGSIYFQMKQFQKAVQHYTQAIQTNNQNPKYYFNRGNCLSYLKQHDQAIKDFSSAIALDSYNASYFCNRGISYQQLEKYEEAMIDFSMAISLEEKPEYYFNRQLVIKKIKQKF